MPDLHSGFQLCPSLTSAETCIRLRDYKRGAFLDVYHEHVKAHELRDSAITDLLRTLVLRHEEATARQIAHSYLTRRGKKGKFAHPLDITVEYPEPGVIRRYCGGNIQAWIDAVITPEEFRKNP